MGPVWVFGYGSLIWRPDFAFVEQAPATLPGFQRRFWQGSHDHRGTPQSPGRVVTLVPEASAVCRGVAFLIDAPVVAETFEALDYREKNGYDRVDINLELDDGRRTPGRVYIAQENNFAWLGDAPIEQIGAQIAASVGPSGRNKDYLFELAAALRAMSIDDDHVFALEAEVRAQLSAAGSTG